MKKFYYSICYDIEVIATDEDEAIVQAEEKIPFDAKQSRIDLVDVDDISFEEAVADCWNDERKL